MYKKSRFVSKITDQIRNIYYITFYLYIYIYFYYITNSIYDTQNKFH